MVTRFIRGACPRKGAYLYLVVWRQDSWASLAFVCQMSTERIAAQAEPILVALLRARPPSHPAAAGLRDRTPAPPPPTYAVAPGVGSEATTATVAHISYHGTFRGDGAPPMRPRTVLDCPRLWRRRRAPGRAARTRRQRGGGRLPPRPDATGPPVLGSPRPLGLPRPGRPGLPASCGAGKARRRP